jgi:4'-phosphopantetheinyl transferase
MELYWLEQAEADVPAVNTWFSARELVFLNNLRFPRRHADWRLGRWTAKCALADYLHLPRVPKVLAGIELRPSESGAPEVFFADQSSAIPISLSHRVGLAACAVAATHGAHGALGCDLEMIEPRSDAFMADYFTTEEQALVARASALDRSRLLALLWSAKESALKALRAGLRLDTRSVIVTLGGGLSAEAGGRDDSIKDCDLRDESRSNHNDWHPLQVCCKEGQVFQGWWRQEGNLVRTVVAAPPPSPPMSMA